MGKIKNPELEQFLEDDPGDLSIDETDLNREMAMQPANFYYFAGKAVDAEREYELMKQKLGQMRAEVERRIRQKYLESGAKMPTIQGIESEVSTNPGIVAMEIQLVNLKGRMGMAKALKDAWFSRKDMLNEIAKNKRHEIETIKSSFVKESLMS